MNAASLLAQLLSRLDSPSPGVDVVTASETAAWPTWVVPQLRAAGLVLPTTPATFLSCPQCPDGAPQEVFFRESADGRPQAQLYCPDCGFVELQPWQLERLRLNLASLAQFLARNLSLGEPIPVQPGRLWSLGSYATETGSAELALARGATWADAHSTLQLDQVPDQVVLTLVSDQTSQQRSLCLVEVLRLTSQGLMVDAARLRRLVASRLVSQEETASLYLFRREGATWRIRFAGQTFTVHHADGLAYIALLLRHPFQEISCLDLYYAVHGRPTGAVREVVGPQYRAPDDEPRVRRGGSQLPSQLRERASELQAQLEAARAAQQDAEEERIQAQIDALSDALAESKRSTRIQADPAADNVRTNVSKAIRRAITAIRRAHPEAGRFFGDCIDTGHTCCYHPTQSLKWEL